MQFKSEWRQEGEEGAGNQGRGRGGKEERKYNKRKREKEESCILPKIYLIMKVYLLHILITRQFTFMIIT